MAKTGKWLSNILRTSRVNSVKKLWIGLRPPEVRHLRFASVREPVCLDGFLFQRRAPYPFFSGDLPKGIPPLERVVVVGKEAWAFSLLRERKAVQAGDLVITWEAGQNSALDTRRISDGRDVGNVVVQRRTADGLKDAVHDVSFAFAFHAFHPDGVIHTLPDKAE